MGDALCDVIFLWCTKRTLRHFAARAGSTVLTLRSWYLTRIAKIQKTNADAQLKSRLGTRTAPTGIHAYPSRNEMSCSERLHSNSQIPEFTSKSCSHAANSRQNCSHATKSSQILDIAHVSNTGGSFICLATIMSRPSLLEK